MNSNLKPYKNKGKLYFGEEYAVKDKEQWFFDKHGDKFCFLNGELHCTTGPALIDADGTRGWFIHGKCHHLEGPAIENDDGLMSYYIDGIRYEKDQFDLKVKELTKPSIEIKETKEPIMNKYDIDGVTYFGAEKPVKDKEQWFTDCIGVKYCFLNGKYHCSTGPAVCYHNGSKHWYQHGKMHRLSGPASEWYDGTFEYWIEGTKYSKAAFDATVKELSKVQTPNSKETAMTPLSIKDVELYKTPNNGIVWGFEPPQPGKEQWFIDGDGDKVCLLNGEYHCSTGPAIITSDEEKYWYINGKLHRLDGPAYERNDGTGDYWIDGVKYPKAEFDDAKVKRLKPLIGTKHIVNGVEYTLA